jgi:hypothetical protein
MTRTRRSRKSTRRDRRTRRNRRQRGGAYTPVAGIVNDALREWLEQVKQDLDNPNWSSLPFGSDSWPKLSTTDEEFQPGGLDKGAVNEYLASVQAQLTDAIKTGAELSKYLQELDDTEKKEYLAKIEATLRWQAGLPEFDWNTKPLLLWFFANAGVGKVDQPSFKEIVLPTDSSTQPSLPVG